jgi:hypothetical protein
MAAAAAVPAAESKKETPEGIAPSGFLIAFSFV